MTKDELICTFDRPGFEANAELQFLYLGFDLMKLSLAAILFIVGGIISCTDGSSEQAVIETNIQSEQLPPEPEKESYQKPERSKYETKNEGVFGLYYFSDVDTPDERKLIISDDDKPIPPKANDPDESTNPGLQLSHEERFDFEEIEVIGDQVYFKTREVDGIYYEFRGIIGESIEPNFSEDILIPDIKGTLKTIKGNSVIKTEDVELGHAIIA